jgi:hypothetical protein
MNALVRSKQSYCELFIFLDQASIDGLTVVLKENCRLKIFVPQSPFGHKYFYTQTLMFLYHVKSQGSQLRVKLVSTFNIPNGDQ